MMLYDKQIRTQSFKKNIPINNKLQEIVKGFPSHNFIANPTSQYTYLILVDFIKEFSKKWFNRDLNSIKMLDWGCGKGHVTYLLKDGGCDVTSCDILLNAKDDSTFGQETPIIQKTGIHVVPLEHEYILPFEDKSFDVVISWGVLEHVPHHLESLKEINRVLKDNGLLFCYFLPYTYSWSQNLANLMGNHYHDRLYNKKISEGLLEESNFEMLDFWHRAIFPKTKVNYPAYRLVERFDNFLCKTPFKHIATNVEFVAVKK
jgi:SAM-dependent methyltransferase